MATAADTAAYAGPLVPGGGARASPRALAAHWLAMLQDMQSLFVDRQRPVRVVQSSPRGKVLLELYAEAERVGGAGAGVPARLVDPLPVAIERGFREMALMVPARGRRGRRRGDRRLARDIGRGGRRAASDGAPRADERNAPGRGDDLEARAARHGDPVLDLAYQNGVLSFRTTSGAAARRSRASSKAPRSPVPSTPSMPASGRGRFTLRYTE